MTTSQTPTQGTPLTGFGCGPSTSVRRDGLNIWFSGIIDDRSAEQLVKALFEARAEIDDAPTHFRFEGAIHLYINSGGGLVSSAFSIVDFMEAIGVPIYTICHGCVGSAATLLSVAGVARFIMPNTQFMVHQLQSGAMGRLSELKDYMENWLLCEDRVIRHYREHTGLSKKKLKKLLSDERDMSAKRALKLGFADKIGLP